MLPTCTQSWYTQSYYLQTRTRSDPWPDRPLGTDRCPRVVLLAEGPAGSLVGGPQEILLQNQKIRDRKTGYTKTWYMEGVITWI